MPLPQLSLSVPLPVMTAEQLRKFIAEQFPELPRSYEIAEVTDLGAALHLPVTPEHGRPGGTVSGPTMMALVDAAAWVATLSRIGPVPLSVTSSLHIDFLRKPPLDSDLWARADLVRLGRRLSVTEVKVITERTGTLVATSSVTYSIPQS